MTKIEAKAILNDFTGDEATMKATAVKFFNDFELGTQASFVLHTIRIRELKRGEA
jgi:hypothetical protein